MGYIKSLLFFYKNSFGIEWSMNVDIPLNKETLFNIRIPHSLSSAQFNIFNKLLVKLTEEKSPVFIS